MTEDALSTDVRPGSELRPISPLAALTLVLAFPGKTFRRLTERPHWIIPLAFVVVSVMVNRMVALGGGLMDEMLQNEAFLSGAGLSDARSAALTFAVVSSLIAVPIVTLLQTLFFKIAGMLFGGRRRFRVVFSAVCHASVPLGLSALLFAALMPFTHSATAAANLSFLVDPVRHPFLWCLAMELDLSAIWFFVLLGIAAEPVFKLPRKRARLATLLFAVIYILVMSWTGRSSASRTVDPYEGWSSRDVGAVVLHASEGAPAETLDAIEQSWTRAEERVGGLTGLQMTGVGEEGAERIECYLYPSLEEKRRVTDNSALVHRVEWANTVHLAWVEGAEPALTRELVKLLDANAHGKVYTPVIRDGAAVCAGGFWGGMPVRDAGADLLERGFLPELDELVDPVSFVRLDERISQPAAGSLVCFVVAEHGLPVARGLYEDAAGRSLDAGALLSDALGDSLGAIEERWHTHLTRAAGVSAPDDR